MPGRACSRASDFGPDARQRAQRQRRQERRLGARGHHGHAGRLARGPRRSWRRPSTCRSRTRPRARSRSRITLLQAAQVLGAPSATSRRPCPSDRGSPRRCRPARTAGQRSPTRRPHARASGGGRRPWSGRTKTACGTAPAGLGGAHRRAHAELPRLVARGGHHAAAVGVAADDERQAGELRALQHLDGGEEGVEVEVGDDPAHRGRQATRAAATTLAGGPYASRMDAGEARALEP